jgi:hypothetical protein
VKESALVDRLCPACGRWFWPSLAWQHKDCQPAKLFDVAARELARTALVNEKKEKT